MNLPRRVVTVGIAGLSASGLSFLVFVAAGRGLGTDQFADFGAAWGLFFGLGAVLSAIELEASRQAAEGEDVGDLAGASLLVSALVLALGLTLSPGIQRMLSFQHLETVVVVVFGMSAFPLYFFGRGVLAGSDRLEAYALFSFGEGFLRSSILVIAFGTLVGYLVAMVAGPIALIPLLMIRLPWPFSRPIWTAIRQQLFKLVPLLSGNVAGALLITGLPATATVALGDADETGLAIAVALSMVSRFPLVLLQSVYGLLVPWFLRMDSSRATRSRSAAILLILAPVFAVGAVVTFVGTRVVVGASPRFNIATAAVYFLGASLLGAIQVATARLVSLELRSVVQLMWWSAAILAIGTLVVGRLAGFDTVSALGLAQLIGPAIGLTVYLWRTTSMRGLGGGLHAAS